MQRLWGLPLGYHVACLMALLVAAAPFLRLDDTFTADEGAYALQVRAIDAGDWRYVHGAEQFDPEGRWFPIVNSTRGEDGWYPYVKHPAYPVVLLASTRLFGETVGLHVPGLLGVVALAVVAWLLAGAIDERASRSAFWLAAASPAAVNGYFVWAHAPSAAVGGLAALGAVRLAGDGAARHVSLVVACVAAGVLLRAEGVLFAIALALALLVALRGRRPVLRWGVPALVLGVAGLAVRLEERWIASIIGGSYTSQGARDDGPSTAAAGGAADWVRGRLEGAWDTVLQGGHSDPTSKVLVLAALLLLAFGALAALRRRAGWERDVTMALVLATGLYVGRALAADHEAMTGLLAAWPLVVLGCALVPWRSLAAGALVIPLCALYALAVLGTQYRFGGGFEWGGRFLFPILAPLAVLAALGLRRLVVEAGERGNAVTALLVALAVVPVVTGLLTVRAVRPILGDVVDEVSASGARLVVTHSPALPRAAWRTYPDVAWLFVPADEALDVARDLRSRAGQRFLLVVPAATADRAASALPGAEDVSGAGVRRLGWRALEVPAPPP